MASGGALCVCVCVCVWFLWGGNTIKILELEFSPRLPRSVFSLSIKIMSGNNVEGKNEYLTAHYISITFPPCAPTSTIAGAKQYDIRYIYMYIYVHISRRDWWLPYRTTTLPMSYRRPPILKPLSQRGLFPYNRNVLVTFMLMKRIKYENTNSHHN